MTPEQEIVALYDRLQAAHEQLESARAGEAEALLLLRQRDIELASAVDGLDALCKQAAAAAERDRIVALLEARRDAEDRNNETGDWRFQMWSEAIREIQRGEP